MTDQIRTLHERLAVDEAQPSPYTPEELALLQHSAPQLVTGNAQKKSVKQLPAGSAGLVAEAQSFFAARQYDRAEADYLKILQSDANNPLVLGNLAAIELQEGKLDDAEKHIQAAVAQDPNDAFNLATLGYLKFKQEKYDEALDALSRAAKLDPQNPEIQNYLGVTLSNKGLRSQAEAALRKAIGLNPNYADAQNNLAVIYISQTPPLVELARWHYQKSLEAGQPHNPELEKMLAEKGASERALISKMLRQSFHELTIATRGRGFYEFTREVEHWIAQNQFNDGLLSLHVRHTSASLLIQENADPDVRRDLEAFFQAARAGRRSAVSSTRRKATTTCPRTSAPR